MARILVIDDEPLIREFVRLVLEAEGHEVVEAADGEAGIREFSAAAAELVITDILMPGTEGLETIRRLRSRAPELKIIAMSGAIVGDGQLDALSLAREFGAIRTVAKPFGAQQLIDIVVSVLAARDVEKGV